MELHKKIESENFFSTTINKILLLKIPYKHLKNNLLNTHKQITLEVLLNTNNIYHKGFMPIYNIFLRTDERKKIKSCICSINNNG